MANAGGYQQEIDELIAANRAAEEEIARLEQETAPAYEVLGRKVYSLMGALPTEQRNRLVTEASKVDEFAAAIAHRKDDVIKRSERIRQLQEMVRIERGISIDSSTASGEVRVCPACGMSVQVGFSFCPGCGREMRGLFSPERRPIHKECPKCHKRWESDMSFCAECGVGLIEVEG